MFRFHHVPIKPTATSTAGELLDWWMEAQYVFPIGKTAKVTDIETGLSWNLKRTLGEYHADCEPLTSQDAEIMKKIWGGTFSWAVRPVIVEIDGRRLAASVSSMPHDVETIIDNSFGGHHDVHFLNSRRHKDYLIDQQHQSAIKIARFFSKDADKTYTQAVERMNSCKDLMKKYGVEDRPDFERQMNQQTQAERVQKPAWGRELSGLQGGLDILSEFIKGIEQADRKYQQEQQRQRQNRGRSRGIERGR